MKLQRLGPYQLEKILGRGGMGAVYAAHNVETAQRAAVKVLNPVLADDANFRERFKLEVETLKKLLHPNIVQLFAYGEEDDHLFYVMELVEGRSLQDELIAGRRFHWREVARIGIDVAQALKHAHDRGVIHRDLKPANLLINDREQVKLTDFGIAKLYGGASFTADGGVLGTADYMAPEQAEGKPITSRCDLYSLGSVLFALLTGRPPFAGKSLPEVIQGLRFEKPPPLHRLNPDVPDEFESIVNQLLEKDPQKRIPTAVAVANRLKAMVHALSMETRIELPSAADDSPPGEGGAAKAFGPPGVTAPLPIQTSLVSSRPTMAMPEDGRSAGISTGNDAELAPGKPAPAERVAAVTVARLSTRAHGGSEPAETASATEKKAVFTTVSKDELGAHRRIDGEEEHPLLAWLKIGGLAAAVVLLLGGFYYYATLPPNADALYERIQQAADKGGGDLDSVTTQVGDFLAAFPDDPRAGDVRQWQQEIELNHRQRQLERNLNLRAVQDLSPIERAYAQAIQLKSTDPDAARARLQALVDAFTGSKQLAEDPEAQRRAERCLAAARAEIAELDESLRATIAAEKEQVAGRLAAADALEATDPAAADKIRRGIVTLYGDREWAAEMIEQARAKLGKHSAN